MGAVLYVVGGPELLCRGIVALVEQGIESLQDDRFVLLGVVLSMLCSFWIWRLICFQQGDGWLATSGPTIRGSENLKDAVDWPVALG